MLKPKGSGLQVEIKTLTELKNLSRTPFAVNLKDVAEAADLKLPRVRTAATVLGLKTHKGLPDYVTEDPGVERE